MLIPNMILKKLSYVYICCFCLHCSKSEQISKIIVAKCSQGLYRVIEYANSEYDTKKLSYVYICFLCLHVTEVNKFQTFFN